MQTKRLCSVWPNSPEQNPDDTAPIMHFGNDYQIVRLQTQNALIAEGLAMQHCLQNKSDASAHYYSYVKIPDTTFGIYSLRDARNKPHATLMADTWNKTIYTCRGKNNRPVIPKYHPYLIDFFKANEFLPQENAGDTGFLYQSGEYWDIMNLPDDFEVEGNFILRGNKYDIPLPRIIHGNLDIVGTRIDNLDRVEYVGGKVIGPFGTGPDLLTANLRLKWHVNAYPEQYPKSTIKPPDRLPV